MTLDGLRAQFELHKHISNRDLPKRWVSLHLMLYGCWLAGFGIEALAVWCLLTSAEMVGYFTLQNAPPPTKLGRIQIYGIMTLSLVSSICYYVPAVLLATTNDFGLYTLSVVWVLAALATTSTMYNAVPVFYWIVGLPGFVSAFAVLLLGLNIDVQPTTMDRWLLPIGLLCLHTVNTILLLRDYRDTHEELDTTRAEAMERLRKLEHMSSHDPLTDLLSRKAFEDLLEVALRRASPRQPVGVLMVDLNGFKPINDTYGHEAGDAVLVAVAERLRMLVKNKAKVARLGGDEFALLVKGEQKERLFELGASIIESIRKPIAYEDKDLRLSAGVGIAISELASVSRASLYADADQAMYRAKTSKSDAPVIFDPATFAPRLSLIDQTRLATAIRRCEIKPYYQPKIDLKTMSLSGFEALARWEHPDRGVLRPDSFLSDIEEMGLLLDLTQSILRQCLSDISNWVAEGFDPGQVSVNIPEIVLATQSGRDDLDWLLAEYRQVIPHIVFEITEDVFILRSGDIIRASIEHFRKSGIAISMDDFGTGYASFRHLKELTFDEMKIDTTFVAGLGSDPVADVIVKGFASIAHGLGVEIVAEGVETEAQCDQLRDLGCHYAQGFLFGAAAPEAEARDWLQGASDKPTTQSSQEAV